MMKPKQFLSTSTQALAIAAKSSRSLMFCLDSLTSVAKSNVLDNVSLHSIPPISGLEIMVHLIPS
jgi:hypothetical protein